MSLVELKEDEKSLSFLHSEGQIRENGDDSSVEIDLEPIIHQRIPHDDEVEEYHSVLNRCYESMNKLTEAQKEVGSAQQGPLTEEDVKVLEGEVALCDKLSELMQKESRTLTSQILHAKRNHLGD
ncbi:uncharacterized protein Z519_07649 [Cladophialophora bantiana CBS 173.52]|uniref:Uncharacterized protein n=1 Tax=Cladophialophora bantiana (strain ATCC 10958 / CBS 173.52 / CDC B-1940 / NIH 8579) TaxID=1442370 RepID=A0A0D2ENX4_CLAB1|nr:uncharacterized protein Z519_07649 [Cladophialophora bantiana CBS 173.52]KIW91681.1 hypothetical protein Z519_07649 [Cladophialophora bantiana CBS 173.52]